MERNPEAGGVAVSATVAYPVIVEWAETNYSAYSPDVPGCVTTGATVEETLANMGEALEVYLQAARDYGEPIPHARSHAAMVEVSVPAAGDAA